MTPTITFIKNHWQMILIVTLIYTLWQTDFVQPIRVPSGPTNLAM